MFKREFRRELNLGKYTRWVANLTPSQLQGLFWALGEFGARSMQVRGGVLQVVNLASLAKLHPRALAGLHIALETADGLRHWNLRDVLKEIDEVRHRPDEYWTERLKIKMEHDARTKRSLRKRLAAERKEEERDCAFCQMVRNEALRDLIAYRNRYTAVFPSPIQLPRNRGHMVVVPLQHVRRIYDVENELAGPLMNTLKHVALAVKNSCGAHGTSIQQNNETFGGQEVNHLHFHVIPRFAHDQFTTLDRANGAAEISFEERIEQAVALSRSLRSLLRMVPVRDLFVGCASAHHDNAQRTVC